MNKATMNRETQKWLRDIMRNHFPDLVQDSTFYYQVGGVKFWGINPYGKSAKTISAQVERFLQHSDDGGAPLELAVYVGVSHEIAPPALYITLKENAPPVLQTFGSSNWCMNPSRFIKPPKTTTVPVKVATLRKWQKTIDHTSTEITRASIDELCAIAAEMKTLLQIVAR